MTRNEIENRVKIIRELLPATDRNEHADNIAEMDELADLINVWARELERAFDEFEESLATYETGDDSHQLSDVKEKLDPIAVLFGF